MPATGDEAGILRLPSWPVPTGRLRLRVVNSLTVAFRSFGADRWVLPICCRTVRLGRALTFSGVTLGRPQHTKIMFGMLQIIFRGDVISRHVGVLCKCLIFFKYMGS